jgi:amidase
MPDLALRFHTRSQLFGATLNPWNRELSPGGSSGGEGVALATGMSALGLGNDAGGSVRIPALFNGVAALKPSYGRFPSDRSVGLRDLTLASQTIPVDGVLARSVADLDLAFRVLAGPDPRPWSCRRPSSAPATHPGCLRRIRAAGGRPAARAGRPRASPGQ